MRSPAMAYPFDVTDELRDRALDNTDSLDPDEGGIRPEGALSMEELPPVENRATGRRIFSVEYLLTEKHTVMGAKGARAFLEHELDRLGILSKGKVYPTKNCYFAIPELPKDTR